MIHENDQSRRIFCALGLFLLLAVFAAAGLLQMAQLSRKQDTVSGQTLSEETATSGQTASGQTSAEQRTLTEGEKGGKLKFNTV